jgi:hypothetical protein
VTRAPSGGAHADEQRKADHDTLTENVAWLRAQADAVGTTEPTLQNAVEAGAQASGVAAASELHDLGERACSQIVTAREAIEHLATQLELAARVHAHGDAFARDGLLHGADDPQRLATAHSTSFDEVAHLVADVSEDLPGDEGDRCRARLPYATESELSLLSDLVDAGLTHDQLLRLLQGGHLLLPGHHSLQRWRALPGVEPRTSSHYHPDDRRIGRGPEWVEAARARIDDAHAHPAYGQQYGLKGTFVHEALFGPGPHHTTFVQLERAAPSKLHLVRHIADWVRYRLTRRNQGPYGSSIDTDAKPMRGVVWWKPTKRSNDAVRLQETETETDQIVSALLAVDAELEAQGRLHTMVWRGPSTTDFDAAVVSATDDVARAAADVRAFGARLRREERTA